MPSSSFFHARISTLTWRPTPYHDSVNSPGCNMLQHAPKSSNKLHRVLLVGHIDKYVHTTLYLFLVCCQRKLGSNTSVLRTNRIVRLDLDEGWCEWLHHVTIHHKRIDLDEGRCETLHHITIHHKRIDLDEGRCETLHHITIHHKRTDLDEGRRETLHYITIHHKRIDLHECCMRLVLGRKPEHETLCFSV